MFTLIVFWTPASEDEKMYGSLNLNGKYPVYINNLNIFVTHKNRKRVKDSN